MNETLGLASIPAVKQYLHLAQELNIDTLPIIDAIGVTQHQLQDNSLHISGFQFQQLIEQLIKISKDNLFGLHTAKFVQPGSYSVLGYISMNCETLGEAISKIPHFEKLVGDMGTTTIEISSEYSKISWNCVFSNDEVRRHMIDNCLASWLTFARYLVNQHSKPIAVYFSRKKPSTSEQQEYQKIFDCQIYYDQAEDAILFDSTILSLPLNKGDRQLLSTLELHAESIVSKLNLTSNFTGQVSLLIKQNLENGGFHQSDIAKYLSIGGKTLQRRLKKEETTFQKILDSTRLAIAKQLLADRSNTLNHISLKLGFNESRSFYRWFNRLTGKTPGNYRLKIND